VAEARCGGGGGDVKPRERERGVGGMRACRKFKRRPTPLPKNALCPTTVSIAVGHNGYF
jgi:hypothetical protein